ncbi:hypothetical protein LEN26_007400 [Aphanomyces euteiches]|nr:hypothetical protein AeMF1_012895 [Aphanomyces euteiches]KAH9132490.1 hypothetical protein LEN26_007400 [Aphanomyces euteiches]KAH9192376.1 hypothetical protein AeNC1_005645 [Aphanomyces euteiches]
MPPLPVIDPFWVVLATVLLVCALQLSWLERLFVPRKASRQTRSMISHQERGVKIFHANDGDLLAMSLRESMFTAGAIVNGGYHLSIGFTLHHPSTPALPLQSLEQALRDLQLRHPFLRAQVVLQDDSPPTYAFQMNHALVIPIIAASRAETSMDSLRFKHRSDRLRMGEPLFRVLWVADDNGKTEVLLLAHHVVCDGRSMSALAHELLLRISSMASIAPEIPQPLAPSCDAVALRNIRQHPWRSLQSFVHGVATAIRGRGALVFPINHTKIDQFLELKDNAPIGLTAHVPCEITSRFVAACKAHGVTVTAGLGAILAQACADLDDAQSTKVSLGTIVDARNLGEESVATDHVCCFAAPLPIFSRVVDKSKPVDSMWAFAQSYGVHLAECTQRRDGIVLGLLMGYRMKKMMSKPQLTLGRPTVLLSNAGVLPHLRTTYGDMTVSSANVTSNQFYSFPKVSVSTQGNIMTFNFDGVAPILDKHQLELLQERTLYHLNNHVHA